MKFKKLIKIERQSTSNLIASCDREEVNKMFNQIEQVHLNTKIIFCSNQVNCPIEHDCKTVSLSFYYTKLINADFVNKLFPFNSHELISAETKKFARKKFFEF